MKEDFLALFEGIPYNIENGPYIRAAEDVFDGINCQLMLHIVMEELGYALPKHMRSSELFEDESLLRPVYPNKGDGWRVGDILFSYSREVDFDPRDLHVSVCVAVEAGAPQFIHAIKFKGTNENPVVLWNLDDFLASSRHQAIVGVKRTKASK